MSEIRTALRDPDAPAARPSEKALWNVWPGPCCGAKSMNFDVRRILVVDDNDASRNAIAEYLTSKGSWRVRTASRVADALTLIEEWRFQAVLVDLCLERGIPSDGLEVAEAARAARPSMRIVAITGSVPPDDVLERVHRVADAFIQKPAALADVERALAGARAR